MRPSGLTTRRPAAQSIASYFANPAAGFSMALDEQGTVAITPYVPTDQRLEDGQGLTWRTGALTKPLTLSVPLVLHLSADSTPTEHLPHSHGPRTRCASAGRTGPRSCCRSTAAFSWQPRVSSAPNLARGWFASPSAQPAGDDPAKRGDEKHEPE
jgi:hypothetical protein